MYIPLSSNPPTPPARGDPHETMTPDLTLRAWYTLHFARLYHANARGRTVEAYQSTIAAWERATNNPPLGQITNVTLAEARARMQTAGLAPTTINKHLRHINHLVAKAAPPGPRNRDAIGIIAMAPWVARLPTDERTPKVPTLASARRMYRASTPYMQSLLVTLFHTGSRITAAQSLTAAQIDWAPRLARFAAASDKKRRDRTKPLSSRVIWHLSRLRTGDDTRPILHWGRSKDHFYDVWHRTQIAAGLTDDELFTPHSLKRLCGTTLAEIGASPWAIRHMLDHAQRDVTGQSYISPIGELRNLVEKLPWLATPANPDENAAPHPANAHRETLLDGVDWL